MRGNTVCGTREALPLAWRILPGPHGEPVRGTTVMDGDRESDSPIVSAKLPNNGLGAPGLAEGVERRGLAKGNLVERHRGRPQSRGTLSQAHDWVRQALGACAS